MSGEKGATYADSLLKLVFNATTFTGIAVNDTGTPLANLYVSLHTADPTSAGSQTSSEISYTGYARQPVARTTGGWTVTTNSVSPAATIVFPASTGGTGGTATYFGVGTLVSGAGVLFYAGPITPNIVVASGVTPELTTATAVTES